MDNHPDHPLCSISNTDLSVAFSFSSENIVLQNPKEDQDSEFEFICITPDSPASPADDLFFNGQLQPHVFPFKSFDQNRITLSRCTSLTSSNGSKDSFASSRSNSSNSSSCSSARTSSSEYRELQRSTTKARVPPYAPPAQRWQFITPAPMFSAEVPRRKSFEAVVVPKEPRSNKQVVKSSGSSWFILRLLRSILFACRACHSLEPSDKKDGSR
ncbi:hypothetical protein ACHQM5_003271 [Ranunculus cassubicifolius]